MSDHNESESPSEKKAEAAAALFDLRTVIAVLFLVYGVLLLIVAFVTTDDAELKKAGGIHINLYSGIVMLIAGVGFLLWMRAKPPLLPKDHSDEQPPGHG